MPELDAIYLDLAGSLLFSAMKDIAAVLSFEPHLRNRGPCIMQIMFCIVIAISKEMSGKFHPKFHPNRTLQL